MRFILLILLCFPFSLQANDRRDFDYSSLAHTPVLHEGRIKPLDSFARVLCRKVYGDVSLPHRSAISWLAGVMFNPSEATQERVFRIRVPEVIRILSLPEQPDALYSFSEIATLFAGRGQVVKSLISKDKKLLTENEQELIRLYMSVNDFAEVIGGFSLLFPFPGEQDFNYLDAIKIRERITSDLKETIKNKGDRIDDYSLEEQRNLKRSYRMSVLEAIDSHNTLLRVIPPAWEGAEEWLSPWAVIEKGAGSPASSALFNDWKYLAKSYNENDKKGWNNLSEKLYKSSVASKNSRPEALALEVIYNEVDPVTKSVIGYGGGAAIAILGLILASGRLRILSFVIISGSAFIHGLALLARMIILMRPPVSTLYESMIFVSFILACAGLLLEYRKGSGESLVVSGIVSGVLITAANVFAADSDTLEVLVAVLNTNFWLGTHVICITTGYACAILAGAIAHIYLIKRAIGKTQVSAMAAMHRRLHGVALVALLFTAVGTMLGGIWADQSWGRFWGWDPKENGALWIVLWLIWLLHGRIAGQLRETGFAVGMAFINIVVALAWVGVNLLSVGLHSYGFTDTAANGLMFFCAAEVLFIGGVTFAGRSRVVALAHI